MRTLKVNVITLNFLEYLYLSKYNQCLLILKNIQDEGIDFHILFENLDGDLSNEDLFRLQEELKVKCLINRLVADQVWPVGNYLLKIN